ncbi:30S ribosomal protein S8e [Candidatus Pacearchaeota archaeon CG10_big_fil_rev_8_21_14_0_10_35_13]|nr:MAG: 30S ribosomal protein S8e [Candidatus Pacearchaeota archaeon CG10_big_fil_rev_8_21_14_0_10_35_13]
MKKGKKISGGRYHQSRKKKHYEATGQARVVKIGDVVKKRSLRTRGGHRKTVLLTSNLANVINPKTKKAKVVAIKNVLETPSNKFLARQNILQKSSVIETELGKARITNRPSQEGCVQAVLIVDEK